MAPFQRVPEAVYGVLQQDRFDTDVEEAAEQVRRLGYAVLDSDFTASELQAISEAFNIARANYIRTWGEHRLRGINEYHTMRAPLTHGGPEFLALAMNGRLLSVLKRLINGAFILNQQNGVVNPPGETYSQGAWHRDLPYQHYVSSSPLAVNALFCLDDFTLENGSTFVLPATHKADAFPSERYFKANALQLEARAGQYIILDCMIFHSGGFNRTDRERRAVNHVYSVPYFKQQINIPKNMNAEGLSATAKQLFGFPYGEPETIEAYFRARSAKTRP
jgi:ectoine hydroxylase-related dioxygenase (phytanoyl-CoA dioxygenase family)